MATELPTTSELTAIAQQAIRSKLDPAGTGAVDLNPGSGNDLFISAAVALETRNAAHIADRAAARSPRTARGEDLDILGSDIYNTQRKPANAATGTLYLQRPSGTVTVIPAGSRFSAPAAGSTPSVTFSVDEDVPAANAQLTVSVPVTCTLAGKAGNVPLSTVTSVVDPLPDTTWALYVPVSPPPDIIAGGDDGEIGDDDAFSARLVKSSFNAAANPGTRDGILAKLLEIPGVFDVTLVSPGDGTIVAFVGDVNYLLSAALLAQVLAVLETIRAFGNPDLVRPYTVVPVSITGAIYMNRPVRNYDESAIRAQAVQNVITYFNTGRESPDSYFLPAISSSIETAHPEVQTVALTAPVASIPPMPASGYSAPATINRYTTSSAYISIVVLDPQTA